MAIENGKILNVRIKNKYDSYDNWSKSGLILEPGEIAIAYTTVDVKVDNGTAKHPALLMKVGDGEKTFANLPWLSAKAADVLSACKNEDDLKAFVNGVITNSSLATKVTTIENDLNTATTGLKARVTTAEEAIVALEDLVGGESVEAQIEAAITALNLGGTYATKTEAQGYADAKDEAIAAAKSAADAAQGEVDALETYVGTFTHDTAKSVVEYINAKTDGIATSGNLEALGSRVTAIENDYLKKVDKTALQEQITANDGEILALQGLVGETAVAIQISTAVTAEETRAKAAEKANADAIDAIEADYLKAADKTELTNAIATAKQEAVATVLGEGTSEDFDTLKEVADWILSDTTGAAALQTDVANIKKDYLKAADKTELEGKITTAQNAADKAQGEVDALEVVVATKAAQTDHEALAGRVTTVEGKVTTLESEMDTAQGDIDALEEKVGEKSVATQISEAIAAEDLDQYALASDLTALTGRVTTAEGEIDTAQADIDALEALVGKEAEGETAATGLVGKVATLEGKMTAAEADIDSAEADITALQQTRVETVTTATGSGLKATRTNNDVVIDFDETITLVFDCGGAEVTTA